MKNKYAVLVATYRRRKLLDECLFGIARQTYSPHRVIVLDQGSDSHIKDMCHKLDFEYQLCSVPNKSMAINFGIRISDMSDIVIIDDDCIPDSNWMKHIHHSLVTTGSDIVTGRVLAGEQEDGACRSRLHDSGLRQVTYRRKVITPIFIMSGCNVAIRRKVFETIGCFDERFGPGGRFKSSDDNEFAYRALNAGLQIVYEPTAIVTHRSWRSTAQDVIQMNDYGYSSGVFFNYMMRLSYLDCCYHVVHLFRWLLIEVSKELYHRRIDKPHLGYLKNFLRGFKSWK